MIFPRQTASVNGTDPSSAVISAVSGQVISRLTRFYAIIHGNLLQARATPSNSESSPRQAPASNSSDASSSGDTTASSVSQASPSDSASAPGPSSASAKADGDSASRSAQSQTQQQQSQSASASASAPDSQSPSQQPSSSAAVSSAASLPLSASSASPASSALPSSSVPTPTSNQAPTSSGTDAVSANPSVSFTTFVTNIGGQQVTVTSAFPTSLATAGSGPSPAQRTAIIAGATAAGVGLVLIALGAVFVYKRHKSRKREFSEALGRVRREAHGAGGIGLLDDEGFDDDDSVPMRRYRDNAPTHSPSHSRDINSSSVSLGPPQSPAPSLFRQRAETGSLFREEGVWPPPGSHFVDPLVGPDPGLGDIVDDIMGPPASSHPKDEHSSSSSGLGFADPAHRGNAASMSSLYNDPFRDISHAPAPSDPSLYYDRRGASSSMSIHSQQTSSGDRPTTPQSLLGLPAGAATPKKSSPLASTTMPPSSATWLTRSPKRHSRQLSGSQNSHEGDPKAI